MDARKKAEEMGFWRGGDNGQVAEWNSGGIESGYPGRRGPSNVGVYTRIEPVDEPDTPQRPDDES